jgi:hypothetical protein
MFWEATSFNQPLSSWNISSATNFVSAGLGAACDSAAFCYCRLRRHVYRCWRQHGGCCVAHACNTITVLLIRNRIMNVNKRSNIILTLSFFFSTSQYHQYHHYSRYDDLEQYCFYTLLTELHVLWSYVFQPNASLL